MAHEIGSEEHLSHLSLVALDASGKEAEARRGGDFTGAAIFGSISSLATWLVAYLAANT